MCVLHFVYLFVSDGHLGRFYPSTCVNNTAVNVAVQLPAFTSFGYIPEVDLLGHMVMLFSVSGVNTILDAEFLTGLVGSLTPFKLYAVFRMSVAVGIFPGGESTQFQKIFKSTSDSGRLKTTR